MPSERSNEEWYPARLHIIASETSARYRAFLFEDWVGGNVMVYRQSARPGAPKPNSQFKGFLDINHGEPTGLISIRDYSGLFLAGQQHYVFNDDLCMFHVMPTNDDVSEVGFSNYWRCEVREINVDPIIHTRHPG